MSGDYSQFEKRKQDHIELALAEANQAAEVQRTEDLLAGELKPRLFRYPYGNSTCATNEMLHASGYKIVGWHVDSCDWAFDKNGAVGQKEAAICGVLPQFEKDYRF